MTGQPDHSNFRAWVEGDQEAERIAEQSSDEAVNEALEEALSRNEKWFYQWWDSIMTDTLVKLEDALERRTES